MENGLFATNEYDEAVVSLYKEFVPKKVFDAHTHAYCIEDVPRAKATNVAFCREKSGYDAYVADMQFFLPGAEQIRLNMMPMPDPFMNDPANGARAHANAHICAELDTHPGNVGAPYIFPADTEEEIWKMLEHPGMRSMKVYYMSTLLPNPDPKTFDQTSLRAFLPEAAWSVSSQSGYPIVLHMMKSKALSDPENIAYITKMAKKHPDAKLILAHCARGFKGWTTTLGMEKLAGLENIWFDLSAICEPTPMASCILQNAGRRVLWGSDYPICMLRGKAISLSTESLWIQDPQLQALQASAGYMIGENLFAFYQAAKLLNLDQTQINGIFYDNAMRAFQLTG